MRALDNAKRQLQESAHKIAGGKQTMKRFCLAAVLMAAICLVGCQSTPNLKPNPSARLASGPAASIVRAQDVLNKAGVDVQLQSPTDRMAQEDPDFVARLNEARKVCETNAKTIGLSVDRAKDLNLGIAAIGIIAGSIVVPALAAKATAARSAVAAWGGVAGAANAAQFSLGESGRSPQDRAKAQKSFYDRVNVHIDALSTTTIAEKEQYLWKLNWICTNAEDDTGSLGPEAPKPVQTTTTTKPGGETTTTTIVK